MTPLRIRVNLAESCRISHPRGSASAPRAPAPARPTRDPPAPYLGHVWGSRRTRLLRALPRPSPGEPPCDVVPVPAPRTEPPGEWRRTLGDAGSGSGSGSGSSSGSGGTRPPIRECAQARPARCATSETNRGAWIPNTQLHHTA